MLLRSSIYSIINNDNAIVLKVCEEILSTLPESVSPEFTSKHLQFTEALAKLPEKLGQPLKKQNQIFEINWILISADKYYENAALITTLRQEVDRFNRLLNIIHKTLNDLRRAIKGEIIISSTLEKTYESLLIQKVPVDLEVLI